MQTFAGTFPKSANVSIIRIYGIYVLYLSGIIS